MVKSSASSVIMPKIGGSSISGIPLITFKKKMLTFIYAKTISQELMTVLS